MDVDKLIWEIYKWGLGSIGFGMAYAALSDFFNIGKSVKYYEEKLKEWESVKKKWEALIEEKELKENNSKVVEVSNLHNGQKVILNEEAVKRFKEAEKEWEKFREELEDYRYLSFLLGAGALAIGIGALLLTGHYLGLWELSKKIVDYLWLSSFLGFLAYYIGQISTPIPPDEKEKEPEEADVQEEEDFYSRKFDSRKYEDPPAYMVLGIGRYTYMRNSDE